MPGADRRVGRIVGDHTATVPCHRRRWKRPSGPKEASDPPAPRPRRTAHSRRETGTEIAPPTVRRARSSEPPAPRCRSSTPRLLGPKTPPSNRTNPSPTVIDPTTPACDTSRFRDAEGWTAQRRRSPESAASGGLSRLDGGRGHGFSLPGEAESGTPRLRGRWAVRICKRGRETVAGSARSRPSIGVRPDTRTGSADRMTDSCTDGRAAA